MAQILWEKCLGYLQEELPAQQFKTWIRPLRLDTSQPTGSTTSNSVCLLAPNRFVLDWVNTRLLDRIESIIQELGDDSVSHTVILEIGGTSPNLNQANRNERAAGSAGPMPVTQNRQRQRNSNVSHNSGLNANATFENFIEGKSNQLARAASYQIGENPGGAYNPLFI